MNHELTTALRAHARGIYCLEAATEILIGHRTWLHRAAFTTDFITTSAGINNNIKLAYVDWQAIITALETKNMPCSGSEEQMLRLTASLADGIPVNLRDALTGLDDHNTNLVATAVLHASGRRQTTHTPRS